jgi:hypothetical protein
LRFRIGYSGEMGERRIANPFYLGTELQIPSSGLVSTTPFFPLLKQEGEGRIDVFLLDFVCLSEE